ncbi:hypothetical protein BH11PLA1_BH11PLA1_17750 [soil metagenome]
MPDNPSNSSGRVSAIASRLRLLQSELADRSSDVRAAELRGEIMRETGAMSRDEKAAFLAELSGQFPRYTSANGAGGGPSSGAAALQSPPKPPPPPGPADAPRLADEIGKLWPMLTEELRQQVRSALGAAVPPATASLASTAPEWRRVLGMNADDPVDAARSAELGAALTQLVANLDRVACGVWKETNTSGENKRAETLKTLGAQYVRGWQGASQEKVQAEIESLQMLVLGLLKAMQQLPSMFADRHLQRFDPAVIMANVSRPEGTASGWFGGDTGKATPVKCWEEYKRLMSELDKNMLTDEMKAMVTDVVNRLYRHKR